MVKEFIKAVGKNLKEIILPIVVTTIVALLGVFLQIVCGLPFALYLIIVLIASFFICCFMDAKESQKETERAELRHQLNLIEIQENKIYEQILDTDDFNKRDELYKELRELEAKSMKIEAELDYF